MSTDNNVQPLTNEQIAQHLEQIADFLELQDANPHRVRAYRTGAKTIRSTNESVAELATQTTADQTAKNDNALEALPGIGQGLAWLIRELVQTGHTQRLDRLRGDLRAADRFRRVPGVGPVLAKRVADTLEIETLPELEIAAYDGRLATVEGFGARRVQAVRDAVGALLTRSGRRRQRTAAGVNHDAHQQPAIQTLLGIDEEYRRSAKAGKLRKIAPRRFNPNGEAWLPILHTEQAGWDFTALFSNTARAHDLDKTDDWVVLYFDQDGHAAGDGHEGQCTVVTETTGPLKGKRVVRGRERESSEYYADDSPATEKERQDG